MSTRARSFMWIVVAYGACCAVGAMYLGNVEGNILLHSFVADVLATVTIFVFSRLLKNSSMYDAYWSVIPPLFLVYWWMVSGGNSDAVRMVLLSIVVWYWAIRLTWNWAKHWPGLAHEDWRYAIVRNKAPKFAFWSDFFGIHFFPTVQVFLGMLPMYAAATLGTQPVGWVDYVAFVVGIGAVSLQWTADRQLHAFIRVRKPGDIITHGLWGMSRHPNYLGELLFWCSVCLFGLAAFPQGWWWQILGVIAMFAMFMGASIPLMEQRSLARRPHYQAVIDSVPMLFPRMGSVISGFRSNLRSK